MGLFSKLFGNVRVRYVYGGASAQSAPFDRAAYEHETIRAVIDCIATHAAKAEALHVIVDERGRIKKVLYDSPYTRLLNHKPNDFMTGFDLKYKLFTQQQANTTAMCYINWDGTTPISMIPVDYNSFDIFPIDGGGYAVKFSDVEGNIHALNIEDVVILRKFFNTRDVSGDGNSPLYETLDMLKAADDGLKSAVSVANKVRVLLKQKKSMLSGADVQKSSDDFTARFNHAAANGGVVAVDAMEEVVPLNVTPWSANATTMKDIRDGILRYFRTPNAILTSDYTEQQGQAWQESVIEPVWIQAGQAFTSACFTQREFGVGNRIIFGTTPAISASLPTRIQLLNATQQTGELTDNERRALVGLPPIEGGDERKTSLNYVKEKDMTKYQTGEDPKEEPNGQEPAGKAI